MVFMLYHYTCGERKKNNLPIFYCLVAELLYILSERSVGVFQGSLRFNYISGLKNHFRASFNCVSNPQKLQNPKKKP